MTPPIAADREEPGDPPWPGRPMPLGATWDGEGTNFALWASGAQGVELCLFDPAGGGDPGAAGRVHLPGLARLRAAGRPRASATASACTARTSRGAGRRYNPSKLLLDPYARAIDGQFRPEPPVFGYDGDPRGDVPDTRDSAPYVPRSVVVHDVVPVGRRHAGRTRPGTTRSSTSCT